MTDSQLATAIHESIRSTVREYMTRHHESMVLAGNSQTEEDRNIYMREANEYISNVRELVLPYTRITTVRPQSSLIAPITSRPQSSLITPRTYNIPITRAINIPENISDNIPHEFICPITTEIMKDPVILTDGHVYEKSAIKKWLQNNNTSPLTKINVDKDILIPCFVLRKQIQEYLEKSNKNVVQQQSNNKTYNKSKREPTQYNLFVKERMPILKQQNPDKQCKEIMKIIGTEWKSR